MKKRLIITLTSVLLITALSLTYVFAAGTDSKNLDVLFSVEPTITLNLDKTSIDFGTVDLTVPSHTLTSAVNATVQSNTTFGIKAKATDNFRGTSNPANIITIDKLAARVNGTTPWVTMAVSDVTLASNELPTASKVFPLDFKLSTDIGMAPDNYKATLVVTAAVQ